MSNHYQDMYEKELRQQLSDYDRREAHLLAIGGEVQEQLTHIQSERAYIARRLKKLREINHRYSLRGKIGSSYLDEVYEE